MCFGFGFGMSFVAKARQKMNNHCTPKSRNLELDLTKSVFLLAASLNFKIYWRALLSFPVLANTGVNISTYIYIYIYTSVDLCISMHRAMWIKLYRHHAVMLSVGGLPLVFCLVPSPGG